MRYAIVIATSPDRPEQAARARRAYLHETPYAQIVLASGRDQAHAWSRGILEVSAEAEFIHFSCDRLEPHPGWTGPARGDGCRKVASPMLWDADGTPPPEAALDWAPAFASVYPTLTRAQLSRFGPPPLGPDCGAEFVMRVGYAFTIHED